MVHVNFSIKRLQIFLNVKIRCFESTLRMYSYAMKFQSNEEIVNKFLTIIYGSSPFEAESKVPTSSKRKQDNSNVRILQNPGKQDRFFNQKHSWPSTRILIAT